MKQIFALSVIAIAAWVSVPAFATEAMPSRATVPNAATLVPIKQVPRNQRTVILPREHIPTGATHVYVGNTNNSAEAARRAISIKSLHRGGGDPQLPVRVKRWQRNVRLTFGTIGDGIITRTVGADGEGIGGRTVVVGTTKNDQFYQSGTEKFRIPKPAKNPKRR